MKSAYSVLVVDNRKNVRDQAESQVEGLEAVELDTADTAKTAKELITSHFYDLAIVDLKLDGGFESGREVLSHLRAVSPVTERVAMSRHVRSEAGKVLNLVSPFSHLADSVLEKSLGTEWFREIVIARLDSWRSCRLEVVGIDELIEEVSRKDRAKRLGLDATLPLTTIRAEIEYIVSGLFGGFIPKLGSGYEPKLELRSRLRGLSPSVVVEAVPQLGEDSAGQPVFGNRCMVKLGSRESTADEARRYDEQVRYGVRLESRVELLGFVGANHLAGICYSFAGGSDSEVTSLDELVRDRFHDGSQSGKMDLAVVAPALKAVDYLFGVDSRQWYGVSGPEMAPGIYFEQELGTNLIDRTTMLAGWAQSVAERSGGRWKGSSGKLNCYGAKLMIPTPELFGSALFTATVQSCLAHGDMHGGNIMLDETGRISLIDYAHSGFAPRAIDAAVLNGTFRLWDSLEHVEDDIRHKRLWRWLDKRTQAERQHLHASLLGREGRTLPKQMWLRLARTLDSKLLSNFSDSIAPISEQELVATYCLQACRLLALPLSDVARLRLAAWTTPLIEHVHRIDK